MIRGINTTYLRETLSKISQKITDDKTNFDIYYPNEKWKMHFQNEINAILPSNLYAIIGNNGVGKTRILRDLAIAILNSTNNKYSYYFNKNTNFYINNRSKISSIIYISLSPFDIPNSEFIEMFNSPKNPGQDKISTIKNIAVLLKDGTSKIIDQIFGAQFLDLLHTKEKIEKIKLIIINFSWDQDLNNFFNEILNPNLINKEDGTANYNKIDEIKKELQIFSSGQKYIVIILLTIIENIVEKSMLIIDEPEDFLHPPYVAALINTISSILRKVKGLGIIATHSDVVLQELPKDHVYHLEKDRTVSTPSIQTFAADVSLINREIFGIQLQNTGYYNFLKDLAQNDREKAQQLLNSKNGELGESGKFYLSLLLSNI